MHELALMEEVRQLAEQELVRAGARQIHRMQLRIGSLSGVNPEALRLAFAVVMADDNPNGEPTTLDLEVVPTLCFCPHCQQSFAPADVIHACHRCGALSSQLLQGRELELVQLEVS
jgi:hydrogenase nickel incorporation protein HypA/HybF